MREISSVCENTICYLITLLNNDNSLLRVALKCRIEDVPLGVFEDPMEHGNKIILTNMLPLHCRTIGPIVAVEEIFEAHGYWPDQPYFFKCEKCYSLYQRTTQSREPISCSCGGIARYLSIIKE